MIRVVLVTALVVLAGACTGGTIEPAPRESRAAPPESSVTTYPPAPVAFDERPLWSGPVTARPGEIGATFAGDALVQVGLADGESYRRTLSVVDAATGKVRWSLRREAVIDGDGARLGFLAYDVRVLDADGDWSVLVQYEKDVTLPSGAPGREEGLAALSGADGKVRWRFPVLTDRRIDSGPATGEPWSSLTTFRANERFAVASVTRHGARNERTGDTWIGFDLASRTKLWEVPWAAQDGQFDLVGDVVVGEGTPPGAPVPDLGETGVEIVAGVDATTGARRWDTAKAPANSGIHGIAETGVLVATGDRGARELTLVDPATGELAWDLDLTLTATDLRCRAGTLVLACHDDDGAVLVLDPATRRTTRFEPEPGYELSRIWADRIVLAGREGPSLVVDRDGNPLVTPVDGTLRDLDERYAAVVETVVETEDDPRSGRLAVYRLPI